MFCRTVRKVLGFGARNLFNKIHCSSPGIGSTVERWYSTFNFSLRRPHMRAARGAPTGLLQDRRVTLLPIGGLSQAAAPIV
ncbi:hypothetical protein EBB04_28650 [Sinorhizobium meliloti]|nr:hypothetical protein EBB04_28650 [Sinorhizobium meliloti]